MSRVTGTSYSISSPTRICAHSGQVIPTGAAYVAVLAQSLSTEEFVRLDYLAENFDAAFGPATTQSDPQRHIIERTCSDADPAVLQIEQLIVLGYWRSKMPEPGAKPRLLIDDASLLDLFEQTAELCAHQPTSEREAFLFVLGLILIRKRLLVVERSSRDGMHVRPKGPKPEPAQLESVLTFVRDPSLDEATITSVAQQLQAVMGDATAQHK